MEALITVYQKSLTILKEEVLSYDDEDLLYKTSGEIRNSGGNLTMHLTGNLRHFIGAVLGGSGYIRNREEEFSGRFSVEKLVQDIEETTRIVEDVLSSLDAEKLSDDYPQNVFGKEMSTSFFLFHLLGHLNYHLGQINYHRRLITK
ncbi:MAG: putative damage-inducible protein DinB [Algoriphagus sp.]|jgi:uncharacterized damage-inducible protein DinB